MTDKYTPSVTNFALSMKDLHLHICPRCNQLFYDASDDDCNKLCPLCWHVLHFDSTTNTVTTLKEYRP